mgnify:CR=1 FL=1
MHDLTEPALVERLRQRDERAVAELVALYGHKIFQLALRHLRNHEDAEEVVQDVLLKVCRKIDLFRGDAALSSWIFRITFNTAMSRLRRGKVARQLEADVEIGANGSDDGVPAFDPADWSQLADESMLRQQLRDRFMEAVHDIPEIYRTPVILRDVEGLSTEEASSRLRVKDQTLKSRLHRGRIMLRERLKDFAGGLSLKPSSVATA